MRLQFTFILILFSQLPLVNGQRTPEPEPLYEQRSPSNHDGIGKFYMGREISHVMGHQGASWLERPSRKQEERTDLLIESLPIKEGDVIADIGAGSGDRGGRPPPQPPLPLPLLLAPRCTTLSFPLPPAPVRVQHR